MKALSCLLPLALLLASCGSEPKAPQNLPADAAAEYIELRQTLEPALQKLKDEEEDIYLGLWNWDMHLEETLELLEQYAQSGDARLRTPTLGLTPLHLAAQYRKEALVRELLKQGADPNATLRVGGEFLVGLGETGELDGVLVGAILPSRVGDEGHVYDAATAIRLIDTLVAAGADVRGKAAGHGMLLSTFFHARDAGAEDVYLHLLELGADPCQQYHSDYRQAFIAEGVLRARWPRALAQLIERGIISADLRNTGEKTLLFSLLEEHFATLRYWEEEAAQGKDAGSLKRYADEAARDLATATVLLEHGADPNAPQGGGWTPMNFAARMNGADLLGPRSKAGSSEADDARLRMLGLLLRHGGDEHAPIPHTKSIVCDYLPQMMVVPPPHPEPEARP